MQLMITVILYGICVTLIRGTLLKIFGGKNPTGQSINRITLLAFFWPIWPEIAVVFVIGYVIMKMIHFGRANQKTSQY